MGRIAPRWAGTVGVNNRFARETLVSAAGRRTHQPTTTMAILQRPLSRLGDSSYGKSSTTSAPRIASFRHARFSRLTNSMKRFRRNCPPSPIRRRAVALAGACRRLRRCAGVPWARPSRSVARSARYHPALCEVTADRDHRNPRPRPGHPQGGVRTSRRGSPNTSAPRRSRISHRGYRGQRTLHHPRRV